MIKLISFICGIGVMWYLIKLDSKYDSKYLKNQKRRCRMGEKITTDDVNIYTNSTLKKLDERITKLEEIVQNKEKDKIRWALNQFKYKEKTEEEQEAFLILERAFKKTPLR